MSPEDCTELARIANAVPRMPRIAPESTREELIAWLQACDPNGCHTDALAALDGAEPYALDSAWSAVAMMLV